MPISPGDKLGPYEILARIGEGGMGDVYRARDTRLDRTVAIKVSKTEFSERFEREARAVAALNHPNICTLYDVGPNYLVMEFVEGAPLKGPLPLDQTLKYAAQICAALDHAHKKGITHRDLKPANILATKTGIKLLDFGLAKLGTAGMRQAARPPDDATLTMALTGKNEIVGTLYYMSPEQLQAQATGKEIDGRSDIFSFGLVLYEMLTGKRAFEGSSPASVIAAIIERPAPSIADVAPPALDRVLKRCLEKDPDNRWQTARDLKAELEWVTLMRESASAPPASLAATKRGRWRERLAWMVAGAALLAALGVAYFNRSATDTRAVRLALVLPESLVSDSMIVSPDGQKLAFTGRSADGKQQLWVRRFDSFVAQPISQTQGARNPFWSPDGRFIGFNADGKLKKVEVAGGPVTVLCEAGTLVGGAWNREGVIVFTPSFGSALHRVSDRGGQAVALTVLDESRQEDTHMWPSFLPDGHHFIYLARSTQRRQNEIFLGSLDSRETKRLLLADSLVGFVAPGWLVFVSEGALMTQPFDPSSYEVSGKPLGIAEKVNYAADWAKGVASVSANGVLVYENSRARNTQLEWVDRHGTRIASVGAPGDYSQLALSPDDKRAAINRTEPQTGAYDIWLLDLLRGVTSRFTFDPNGDRCPIWSPDGSRIVFTSDRKGGIYNLFQKAEGGTDNDALLLESTRDKRTTCWSKDGRFILYETSDPKTKSDVWVLPLFGDRRPYPLLSSEFGERQGQLSPAGTHLAYVSDESGSSEVYVQAFTADGKLGGHKQRISTSGGSEPRFSRNGRELFYVAADGVLIAVALKTGGAAIEFEAPKALFKTEATKGGIRLGIGYDVTADGQRFLVGAMVGEANAAPVNVILNWTAELKK